MEGAGEREFEGSPAVQDQLSLFWVFPGGPGAWQVIWSEAIDAARSGNHPAEEVSSLHHQPEDPPMPNWTAAREPIVSHSKLFP